MQQSLDHQRALVERHKSMGQLVDAVLATLIDSQGFEPSRVATIVCSISKAMLGGADVTLFIPVTVEESEEFIKDDMHQIDNDLRQEIVVSFKLGSLLLAKNDVYSYPVISSNFCLDKSSITFRRYSLHQLRHRHRRYLF